MYSQTDCDPRQCRSSPDLLTDVSKQVINMAVQSLKLFLDTQSIFMSDKIKTATVLLAVFNDFV